MRRQFIYNMSTSQNQKMEVDTGQTDSRNANNTKNNLDMNNKVLNLVKNQQRNADSIINQSKGILLEIEY